MSRPAWESPVAVSSPKENQYIVEMFEREDLYKEREIEREREREKEKERLREKDERETERERERESERD
jgi:U4/U6.U5 tri-snRNP-associated protein 1